MELASDEPWMVRCFNHFNQCAIPGTTGDFQTGFHDLRQQVVVHFVAMTVTLDDHVLAVATMNQGTRLQQAILRAQAHGAARSEASVRVSTAPVASSHSVIKPTTG